jgi:HK97 family phage portal protein
MELFGYEIGLFYARKAAKDVEQRSVSLRDPALSALFGYDTGLSSMDVSNESILGIPPAWSAIRYISEGIASLERGVFRRQTDGDIFPDHAHPVAYLLEGRPHPNYTAFDFLQALISNACLGNGFARIHFDSQTARPYALELIPSHMVSVRYSQSGQMFYQVSGSINDVPINVLLPETEMIHIKGVSINGITGRQIRLTHKSVFGTAQGAQEYAHTWFDKGAAVGGLITFPAPLSREQRETLKGKLESVHSGSRNAGSIMVLDAGADFKAMQATPKDSAAIDFANLSTVQVSQIFKVPLHLLSQLDRSTFSNMEQQNQDFVVHCLGPWARKIEEEFNTKLFSTTEIRRRSRFFSFDLSALTMGDMQAQAAFFASAIQNGWMTPNEVRAKKHLNRIEGGDKLFIQQNMAPMDLLEDILEAKYESTQTQAGTEAQSGDVSEDETTTPDATTGTNDTEDAND